MPRAGPAPGSVGSRVRMMPTRRAMAASAMAELRQEGNEYFQAGRYAEALVAYARALDLPEAGPEASQRALLYRNRAACHLKLEDYAQAEVDASRALELDGHDVKSLFRRSQASGAWAASTGPPRTCSGACAWSPRTRPFRRHCATLAAAPRRR
ncbi:hypothetical protein E2320_013653 [Naja naja]|nr:hypothetical protein E2320_013653 [Naja naja]